MGPNNRAKEEIIQGSVIPWAARESEKSFEYYNIVTDITPVPVAARSKAKFYGRSPPEIVGSNPTGGMDVCLLWLLFVVR